LRHTARGRPGDAVGEAHDTAPRGWGASFAARRGTATSHSLRHVFCVTTLFAWKLDAADVSQLAGHANVRTTLDMYVGNTAGTLDRARKATQ
jgi:integrase